MWGHSLFYPTETRETCTKNLLPGSPRDLRYLSGCYGHAPASPHAAPTSLTCLISFLRSCAALPTSWGCPPALSWQGLQGARPHLVVTEGVWSLQDSKGLEQAGDCNKQNRCWWLNGPVGFFFFFFQKRICQSELFTKRDTMIIMIGGSWMVYELLAGKKYFDL